jgi:hypothetical protein
MMYVLPLPRGSDDPNAAYILIEYIGYYHVVVMKKRNINHLTSDYDKKSLMLSSMLLVRDLKYKFLILIIYSDYVCPNSLE